MEKERTVMYRALYYRALKAKEIQPEGWFYRQLKIQAEGLCGNLDKVWPDIRESKWLGGEKEGWERLPYWLDGFIPMAWLLKDSKLQERAVEYINIILNHQEEDGWICPCEKEERSSYDVWALFLICKVLVVYWECAEDERIEQAVYRALQCLNLHLERNTLFNWGAARWFECLVPLGWLYDRRPEEWMKELAVKLRVQGIDYEALFEEWPYREPQGAERWSYITHVVNLAMCLKGNALYTSFWEKDSDDFAEKALDILLKYHGMPIGHFTGDECLSGKGSLQGTELCGVVEAMYSYEWLLNVTGKDEWADRLELLAYNALPATISTDMWTHQYDQMSNQVQCSALTSAQKPFRTNGGESHLFGLEPNFGCCTANFGQGWSKLAFSGILKYDGGLAIGAIFPCSARTKIQGVEVFCRVETDYPFEDGYRVIIQTHQPLTFELSLRIPVSAYDITVNGKSISKDRHLIKREWNGVNEITVQFDFAPELLPHDKGTYYAKRGSLVYALPIDAIWKKLEYTKDGVERRYPYCDYELYPSSSWNYAFTDAPLTYIQGIVGEKAFDTSNPPVGLKTWLRPIDWSLENGIIAPYPVSDIPIGEDEEKILVPYGCTDLRMTIMPRNG